MKKQRILSPIKKMHRVENQWIYQHNQRSVLELKNKDVRRM